jgi:acetoacetyl-CoA synthetase
MMTAPLWRPSSEAAAATNLARFTAVAQGALGVAGSDYRSLHRASVADPGRFWSLLWDHAGVIGDKGPPPFLADGDRMPGARFFPGATLNYAENVLAGLRLPGSASTALVFRSEQGETRRVSAGEFECMVARAARMLTSAGVRPGDRVAAILPNLPEAIASVLAASAIGAVWSSCSPDFGVQGVLDRFGQIGPRVLIAVDGYTYAGKRIDLSDKLAAIVAALPTVERVVVVPYLGEAAAVVQGLNLSLISKGRRAETWNSALERESDAPLSYERFAFSHPLCILFSSGTTGVPKCIVHSAGGTLLKHISEQRLHSDLRPGDRLFYFTTLGWMMWNWLVSGLGTGATLLLFDGSPFHPSGNVLWDYTAAEKCTHFGTSAKYVDALKKAEISPRRTHDLSSLRVFLSTGSPLVAESFDFVYEAIKPDVHLASISGGTDIVGCFVLGIPTEPVWRGEIQGPALGVDVDVVDNSGKPLRGAKGELVCRRPFPSMPIGFWGEDGDRKYRAAYFTRMPGLWHHGDFAEWTANGGMIIHGRSDATLNPGGVRIGTAEIYRQVEKLAEIQESIVVGQDWEGDVRVVLFVVLKPGHVLDEALAGQIRKQIREGASPRHVPARIIQVRDIPRTKSGKITELAVRDVIHGRDVANKEALANPEALDLYRDLEELER